jgi:hypothetical protein
MDIERVGHKHKYRSVDLNPVDVTKGTHCKLISRKVVDKNNSNQPIVSVTVDPWNLSCLNYLSDSIPTMKFTSLVVL